MLLFPPIIKLFSSHGDGFVYFSDVLFGALKRAYSQDVFRDSDPALKEFVRNLEKRTLKKLQDAQRKVFLR